MTTMTREAILKDPDHTLVLINLQRELIESQQEQLEKTITNLEKARDLVTKYHDLMTETNQQLERLLQNVYAPTTP